jgi:D-tyrosyl-tRNA(Tyr) deacylase
MKALIQRVNKAEVEIDGKLYGKIGKGILVFVGVERGDSEDDITYLVKKVSNLRIFEDAEKKMNLSVQDIGGEVLVVSQFTRQPIAGKATVPHSAAPKNRQKRNRCIQNLSKD